MTTTDLLRRNVIADNLKKLIEKGGDYTVAQLLATITRKKNFQDKSKELYDLTDIEFSTALQTTLNEIE